MNRNTRIHRTTQTRSDSGSAGHTHTVLQRHGRIRTITTYVLPSVCLLTALACMIWSGVTGSSSATAAVLDGPTTGQLKGALIRVGLDPESLCAAGVTSAQDVASVVSSVRDYLTANPNVLESADSTYAVARVTADRLEKTVKSGTGSGDDVTAYQTARTTLSTAASARQDALDAVFDAGTNGLDVDVLASLTAIRSNRIDGNWWNEIPAEFLVVSDRTESEWIALRDALANERISDDLGMNADQGCSDLLTTERSDNNVTTAKTRLDSHLTTVQTAWDSAVGG